MNSLALNLAHDVIVGKLTSQQARARFGEETLSYMDGKKTAYTQTLSFGRQINTSDKGEPAYMKQSQEETTKKNK
jgi:hypothetical protein